MICSISFLYYKCKCTCKWYLISHSPLELFSYQYKQTMIEEFSNEHNKVKNPNWQEADQLAIYKPSREAELWTTENNNSWWSERDLNPRPTDFRSDALINYSANIWERDNWYLSTGLIMWIGHRKEIRKLTFRALALRRSTTVSLETYPSQHLRTANIWLTFENSC